YLLYQPFPAPDGYAEIAQTNWMTGGEALNSSIVLSRLGMRVLLDGNWIGDTADGKTLLETIRTYNIDPHRLLVKKGYAGVREIVFSDERTRTIFGNYIDLLATTRKWNIPHKADIQRARIVCVDPPFGDESVLVGRYSLELKVPFVSIDCAHDHELATGAEAVIISGEFRDREYPQANLEDLFCMYQQCARGIVVFTVGGDNILFARKGEPVRQFKPYQVKVIDSAGAGDSFRAGIIYGLLHQWTDEATIQYASAVAALVCASFPGVLNSPTHAEVMQFIHKQA
ncbi:MAG: carbohydrate kinase family protein, partial [Anaerolineaceae bacterium]|nr:carbohydrate kinase family protein [Anaerolineaceae bacterium]